MARHRIFTVGFDLPGDEFEYVPFDSDTTLLDADIILFEPTLGAATGYETYNGKMLLNEFSSFNVKQRLNHWRTEISAAVNAGKLVIVYLVKPIDYYRYTGEKQHSGTGRSRSTTTIVDEVTSYSAIPNLKNITSKSGSEIQIDKDTKYLVPYWLEFSPLSPYEVEIDGVFSKVILRSRSGNRTLGAEVRSASGTLLFLPPLRYDKKVFLRVDKKTEDSFWTEEALTFGKKLAAILSALATNLKKSGQLTPPPVWTDESFYRLDSEGRLESEIAKKADKIAVLQSTKAKLEDELHKAGSLRRLLFEQGKPLETAIVEALRLFGFNAQKYEKGTSEFDCVFVSAEGRCLGEAEGKDSKAINIDKFSQLERNLQEDYARDDVTEYAKGVLFGNSFRLTPVNERDQFFTDKCISAAKRVGVALIRTPDLFSPAKYLKENSADTNYAKKCREAIFSANGEIVVFPSAPNAQTCTLEELVQEVETKSSIQVGNETQILDD